MLQVLGRSRKYHALLVLVSECFCNTISDPVCLNQASDDQSSSHVQFVNIRFSAEVPCKRRSSVKSGAWLRRFDDVTGVEKSCVGKGVNGKRAKEKYFIIVN